VDTESLMYTPLDHTPALAGGARELRIFILREAQFVTGGIIYLENYALPLEKPGFFNQ
jgi:hypothetical protein